MSEPSDDITPVAGGFHAWGKDGSGERRLGWGPTEDAAREKLREMIELHDDLAARVRAEKVVLIASGEAQHEQG